MLGLCFLILTKKVNVYVFKNIRLEKRIVLISPLSLTEV